MITPDEFSLTPSEVAENMIFIVDVGTRQIEFASQLAHRNLGYGKGELLELHINDLHPLEMEELEPEEAARVTINGNYAGGFIGKPFRLDVTKYLKHGVNTVKIEPFAPKSVRLVVLEKKK